MGLFEMDKNDEDGYKAALELRVEALCKQLGIMNIYEQACSLGTSWMLPYHNWYHTLCMIENVIEGAKYHDLPFRSMKHLAIAALFHDYDHSGGYNADNLNIKEALRSLAWQLNDVGYHEQDIDEISRIIKATEYPYVIECLSIEQKIIRDADLMQGLRPDWKAMLIDGLGEEMSIRLDKKLTMEEMLEGQLKFITDIDPLSGWGRYVFISCGEKISLINQIKKLLASEKGNVVSFPVDK